MGQLSTNSYIIDVDESIYSRAATLRTAYWFTDRCYVFIMRTRVGYLSVRLKLKTHDIDLQPAMLEEMAEEFMNSLLDNEVREMIHQQTATIRELLVAKALAVNDVLDNSPAEPVSSRSAFNDLIQIKLPSPR